MCGAGQSDGDVELRIQASKWLFVAQNSWRTPGEHHATSLLTPLHAQNRSRGGWRVGTGLLGQHGRKFAARCWRAEKRGIELDYHEDVRITSRYAEVYGQWKADPEGWWAKAALAIDWYRKPE